MPPPAVPTTTSRRPRAIGIIRVSKEGGRGDALLSPEMQHKAVVEHAERKGYAVVRWVEAIDESGSQARSTWWRRLDEVISSIERGEAEVLVAWKFSRVSRSRVRWATAVDRVETAGGRIESATEEFDTTTSTGRFARGMMAELQAFEAERIGETWKDVLQNRTSKGLTHNGRRRFGYVVDANRVHAPDPETGPLLVDLYRRFTRGESVYRLVQWLNDNGVVTTSGGVWTDRTLRRLLDDGFAAGLINYGGEQLAGAHEPLLTPEEWSAYKTAKAGRTRSAVVSQRSPYLLSGMVRCGHCGGSMHPGTFGEGRVPKYRCETKRGTGGFGCEKGGYVAAKHVHAEVLAWLVAVIDEHADEVQQGLDAPIEKAVTVRRDAAPRAEVKRLQGLLTKVAGRWIEEEIGDEEYRALRDRYTAQLDEAKSRLTEAEYVDQIAQPLTPTVVRPLVEEWHTLAVEDRRVMLRTLVSHFEVWKQPGRRVPAIVVPVEHA